MLDKELKEQVSQLSIKMGELSKKVEALNSKLTKVETNSETLVKQSKTLVSSSDTIKAADVMNSNLSDPSGLLAKQISDYLISIIEKQKQTEFRRWISTKGRPIVEGSIASFVSSRVPQLRWYGVSCTKIDENKYHQTAKTSFPVELNTGIPLVGKITFAQCVLQVDGDIDTNTKEIVNLRTKFDAEQPNKAIFTSVKKEIDESLKPHKTIYGVLLLIGKGVNKVWGFLKKETSFSLPF